MQQDIDTFCILQPGYTNDIALGFRWVGTAIGGWQEPSGINTVGNIHYLLRTEPMRGQIFDTTLTNHVVKGIRPPQIVEHCSPPDA